MKKFFLAILLLLSPIAALAQQGNQVIPTASAGVTQAASLPATCTNTSSVPVQLTTSLTINAVTYGAGTLYYCDSTNHYSPVSQGSGASPIMGYYLSSQCPPSNQANCFYTPGDTQQAVDCSWTATSTTVNCASSHFTQADVGKQVMGYINCDADPSIILTTNAQTQSLVNAGVGARAATIQSVQSGTSFTLGGFPADNTASGNTHCLVYGHPDDSYFATADTALQAATVCPKLFLAAGYYFLTAPHFFTQPTGCNQLGTIYQGSAANTVYSAGFEIEGRGTGNTVLFLANDFPESPGVCTRGTTNIACFIRTLNGRWKDFQITGGQNALGPAGTTVLVEADGPGSIDNFTCTNMGNANTNSIGMDVTFWDRWYQVNNSGCGYTATKTFGSSVFLVMYKYRAENSAAGLIHAVPGTVQCIDCGFLGSDSALVSAGLVQNTGGGLVDLDLAQFSPLVNPTGVVGYAATTTAGSTLYLRNSTLSAGSTFNFSPIVCSVACKAFVANTGFGANGTGNSYKDVAGSQFYDQGGNFGLSSGAGVSISGLVSGSSSTSAFSPVLATGNVSITTCGTSTAGTFSGFAQKGQFTITFAGTPGTTCTATVTFPIAFMQTPICTWYDVGGTNAVATSIVNGAVSATSTAVTISGPTFTNGNTEILQYSCSNP